MMPHSTNSAMFWRQLDLVSLDQLARTQITVIGAGGIGSPTVQMLARLGIQKITVYDPDMVELHNLPNQSYRLKDIGKPKVLALAEIVKDAMGTTIRPVAEKFEHQQIYPGIVISGVDSMEARAAIWQQIRLKPHIPLYIDGRMGAKTFTIVAIDPTRPKLIKWYESEMLFTDAQALELPCTARSICYTTSTIAGMIAHLVAEFVSGKQPPKQTIFDYATHYYSTEE